MPCHIVAAIYGLVPLLLIRNTLGAAEREGRGAPLHSSGELKAGSGVCIAGPLFMAS